MNVKLPIVVIIGLFGQVMLANTYTWKIYNDSGKDINVEVILAGHRGERIFFKKKIANKQWEKFETEGGRNVCPRLHRINIDGKKIRGRDFSEFCSRVILIYKTKSGYIKAKFVREKKLKEKIEAEKILKPIEIK